jgi:hypothetical protein
VDHWSIPRTEAKTHACPRIRIRGQLTKSIRWSPSSTRYVFQCNSHAGDCTSPSFIHTVYSDESYSAMERVMEELADSRVSVRSSSEHARTQGYTAGRCGVRLGTRAAPPMPRSLDRRPEAAVAIAGGASMLGLAGREGSRWNESKTREHEKKEDPGVLCNSERVGPQW